jgi:hypothetical protein
VLTKERLPADSSPPRHRFTRGFGGIGLIVRSGWRGCDARSKLCRRLGARRCADLRDAHPDWPESPCAEANATVVIGRENYFLSADGMLMPAKKDQPPPDLRYFKPARN